MDGFGRKRVVTTPRALGLDEQLEGRVRVVTDHPVGRVKVHDHGQGAGPKRRRRKRGGRKRWRS